MIIKLPAAYDIAGSYESVPDWSALNPKPLLVIHKATEGNFYQDAKCKPSLVGMAANGISRGVYHFHRKAINAITQAQYFCNFIQGAINDSDLIVLDIEESGETAKQIMDWLVYVQSQFPHNRLMVYSRKNILDPITMTTAQKDYLRQIPVWTAGYPANPDNYTTPPAAYVPDQTRWGQVWLWQYSVKGIVSGVIGECDLDWIAPEFAALLGAPPPPIDVISYPYDGVKHVSGFRNGWRFELFVTNPAQVDYESVCILAPLETVPGVAARKGAQIAVNGGEWDRVSKPKDYSVSNGNVCQPRIEAVPSLMITDANAVVINHVNAVNVRQALSGLRYLIRGGVIQSYLYGTEPQYIEGHARSIHGKNSIGHHMVMQSEGVYPNQGLRLKEAAEIMKQYGAVAAFDSGGGGDVSCIMDGESLIVPENIYNGVHFHRPLPQVFLIYAKEQGMAKNKVTVTWDAGARERAKPRVSSLDAVGAVLADNSVHYSDFDVVPDMDDPTNTNKRWIQLKSGWYIATRYPPSSGTVYQRAKVEPIIQPADKISVTITDNGVTKTYTVSGDVVVS